MICSLGCHRQIPQEYYKCYSKIKKNKKILSAVYELHFSADKKHMEVVIDRIDAKLEEMELIGKSLRKIKVQRHVDKSRTERGMLPNNFNKEKMLQNIWMPSLYHVGMQ